MPPLPSVAVWKGREDLGLGRVSPVCDNQDVVHFTVFVLPGDTPKHFEVSLAELEERRYEEGTRVFVQVDGRLRPGRIREDPDKLIDCDFLPGHEEGYSARCQIVNFVGGTTYRVPETELNPLAGTPIEDPTALLAEQLTEGRWWYNSRRALRDSSIKQRAAYAGVTSLASSAIDIQEHQFRITQRILHDPVCRYVLADEVGLGKGIEAGIVLRQHLLESDSGFEALVVVPQHLRAQWHEELCSKFGLRRSIDEGQLVLISMDGITQDLASLADLDRQPRMLVIDEAHHMSALAFSTEKVHRAAFTRLAGISHETQRVLLLSATPVLRNESGFLAMLHLLDPVTYPIDDLEGFRERVAQRQPIAQLVSVLAPSVPRIAHAGICQKLRALVGHDPVIEGLVEQFESESRDQWPDIQKKLSDRLRRTHRLYDRLLRTRRTDTAVQEYLPSRQLRTFQYADPVVLPVEDILEDWRATALSSVATNSEEAEGARTLFAEWVTLLLQGPMHLLRAWRQRLEDIEAGEIEPLFPEERTVLAESSRLPDLVAIESISSAVRKILFEGGTHRILVFLSSTKDCEHAAQLVGPRAAVLLPGDGNPHQRVWFVPQRLEEGLNLQSEPATLVHADLPLSQVRIEQRIGRVDRLGGNQMQVLSRVLLGGGVYQNNWLKCLEHSGGVFHRSISNTQYLLGKAEDRLRESLLEHGVEAFAHISSDLSGQGELSLAVEERKVSEQDLLDSSGYEQRAASQAYGILDEYEYGGGAEEFVEALYRWTVEGLKFKALDIAGDALSKTRVPESDHQFQFLVQNRHLPWTFIHRFLGPAISRFRGKWKSDWVTAGRHRAASLSGNRKSLPLRVGHPFVDGILGSLSVDDRGRSFAVWVDHAMPVTGIYLCFDFIQEIPVAEGEPTLRRISDRFLPPRVERVWLTEDGDLAPSDEVDILNRLVAKESPGVSSIKDPSAWEQVDNIAASEWRSTCRTLRSLAERQLVSTANWVTRVEQAQEKISSRIAIIKNELRDREGTAATADRTALRNELASHNEIAKSLASMSPRLDIIGAVVIPPAS